MDLKDVLETIETYARDYIRYVLSVVSRTAFKDKDGDFDPKLISYSLISVVIGGYLFDRFVRHADFTQHDLLSNSVRVFSTWLFIAVTVYGGLNFRSKVHVDFNNTLSIILRVLPVAYVLAAYTAAVLTKFMLFFKEASCAAWWGYSVLTTVEAMVALVFLPLSLARYVELDHRHEPPHPTGHLFGFGKTAILALMAAGMLVAVRAFMVAEDIDTRVSAAYAAESARCDISGACRKSKSFDDLYSIERERIWTCLQL